MPIPSRGNAVAAGFEELLPEVEKAARPGALAARHGRGAVIAFEGDRRIALPQERSDGSAHPGEPRPGELDLVSVDPRLDAGALERRQRALHQPQGGDHALGSRPAEQSAREGPPGSGRRPARGARGSTRGGTGGCSSGRLRSCPARPRETGSRSSAAAATRPRALRSPGRRQRRGTRRARAALPRANRSARRSGPCRAGGPRSSPRSSRQRSARLRRR